MPNSAKVKADRGYFYVQEGCCTSCGVPQSIAPELVGWTEEKMPSCYWILRAEGAAEVERTVKIIQEQELVAIGMGRRREIPLSATRRTQNVRKKKPGRCVRNDMGLFSVPRIGFGKSRRTILGYFRGRPIRDSKWKRSAGS